jgi:4-hydroxy-3-methylbut-2-en-1-yl diphosphate reductase
MAPGEGLSMKELAPGVQLWRPESDLLHDPNVVPQEPGCRQVLVGLPLGECGGVAMANKVIVELGSRSPQRLYGNHPPTHGADSTADFVGMGARFGIAPADISPGQPYVISAHGAAPSVAREAKASGLQVFDVTCPLVYRTHEAIKRVAEVAGGRVAYISFGKPDHPELVGAAGVAAEHEIPFDVIGNREHVDALATSAQPGETIVVVGQTTNNSDQAGELAEYLAAQAAQRGITVGRAASRDVCHTVRDRQESTRLIVARRVGSLVVVGSVNSKNTESLAKVGAEEAQRSGRPLDIYLVNSWGQLPILGGDVGVVSGASTRAQNVHGVTTRLAPRHGVTEVGVDTDKGITFLPVDAKTRALISGEEPTSLRQG